MKEHRKKNNYSMILNFYLSYYFKMTAMIMVMMIMMMMVMMMAMVMMRREGG